MWPQPLRGPVGVPALPNGAPLQTTNNDDALAALADEYAHLESVASGLLTCATDLCRADLGSFPAARAALTQMGATAGASALPGPAFAAAMCALLDRAATAAADRDALADELVRVVEAPAHPAAPDPAVAAAAAASAASLAAAEHEVRSLREEVAVLRAAVAQTQPPAHVADAPLTASPTAVTVASPSPLPPVSPSSATAPTSSQPAQSTASTVMTPSIVPASTEATPAAAAAALAASFAGPPPGAASPPGVAAAAVAAAAVAEAEQLRSELGAAVAECRAKEATIVALREELADTQTRLAKLQLHKKEVAASAAVAISEMAEQVSLVRWTGGVWLSTL